MPSFRWAFLAPLLCFVAASEVPSGLLCDFQKSPALGIRANPGFTWIVPACGAASLQSAYQVLVSDDQGREVWDSGKVASNNSVFVEYVGPHLSPGAQYVWTVTTWSTAVSGGEECKSPTSEPARFVTQLFLGWDDSAKFIGLGQTSATFAYLRKEIEVPSGVVSASAFVTAELDDPLLSGYKFYIDGALVNLGPGRGEANVWLGDGTYRSLPYTTLDVTSYLSMGGKHVLALQAMHQPPSALMQIHLRLKSGDDVLIVTDGSWQAFNGDAHRNPGKAQHGGSAGTGFLEYIDARKEPVGWMKLGFEAGSGWVAASAVAPSPQQHDNLHAKMGRPMQVRDIPVQSIRPVEGPPSGQVACGIVAEGETLDLACPNGAPIADVSFASFGLPSGVCPGKLTKSAKCDANATLGIVKADCIGKTSCSVSADTGAFGDPCYDVVKALAVELKCSQAPPSPAPAPPTPRSFIADFGREFQGGLRLTVEDGVAGTTVHLACGEALQNDRVSSTWGWEFDWILREGSQTLEQHKYMECRFVSLTFSDTAPTKFVLSAWRTNYEWDEQDTAFKSSDDTLNAVWELSRYTLEAASLDTYADSNTRERRPYEADGGIAASARLLVQREYMWGRHSHAWVIQNPTWPVEWKQLTAFLGWQDYQATGRTDLAQAFKQQMYDRSQIGFLENATGLLDTSKMGSHIVDWMPEGSESDSTVQRGEFTASNHHSVSNAFCARGLGMLSQMLAVAGDAEAASKYQAASESLMQAIQAKMWNGNAFCDGVCSEVGGNSRVMTNMFMLMFGLVPEEHAATAWETTTAWGLEQMGDYGAFMYLAAISGSYYARQYYDPLDDGQAVLTALTKCDKYSWCSGLRDDNLTMTRESWHDGTYSHPWGTGAIAGAVWGLAGVHQTAPGFESFTVMPRLHNLTSLEVKVPTLRGHIVLSATPSALSVSVPCNALATLCLPLGSTAAEVQGLLLDGAEVQSHRVGKAWCATEAVSCGSGGKPRSLTAKTGAAVWI